MSDDVVNALLSLALLVASGLFGILIKWINNKIGAENVRKYAHWANYAVNAAETMGAAAGWDGAKKKEYALGVLIKAGLSPEQAETFLEAAVGEMVKWRSELTTDPAGSVVRKFPDNPC
jgi:hypothetical protein